jgi:hypothetical protein
MKSALSCSKNLRTARLQVETLESRVQPSFLTGGLDLGADFGDDLFNDHRHDHLVSLASALAAPPSTTAVSSGVSTASNAGPGGSVAAGTIGGADVTTLNAAARSLAANVSTTVSLSPQHQLTAVPTTSNQAPVSGITDVRDQLQHTTVSATVVRGNNSGIGTRAITWGQYQGDPNFAQWNDVVTGVGAAAGDVFYVGTVTDQNGNAGAAILRIQADGTIGATSYLATISFPFSTFTQRDSINHAALTPDGTTLVVTASISDNVNAPTTGYDGVVASLDATMVTGPAAFFNDSTLNGVTLITTATGYDVATSGKANNPMSTNPTDLLALRVDSTLMNPPVFAETLEFSGSSAGLSASSDPSGNMYIGGTIQSPTDTLAAFGSLDSTGMVPAAWGGFFTFGNVTPGAGGAMNAVVWSNNRLYMTGTLNNSNGQTGPDNQDEILANANPANGSVAAPGWAFRWFNGTATTRTGDLPANGLVVRNGQPITVGGSFDNSAPPGPDMESALILKYTAAGSGITAFGEFGGSGLDNGLGASFVSTTGSEIFWGGNTTSNNLPVTNGSTYGGGTQDAWASRWNVV